MHQLVPLILSRIGIEPKSNYSMEEAAEILGIIRDQGVDMLQRGKLKSASDRRWMKKFVKRIDVYILEVNTLKGMAQKPVSKA
jgi:hypothetical protein